MADTMTATGARKHYVGREIKLYGDPGTKFAGASTMKDQYPAYAAQARQGPAAKYGDSDWTPGDKFEGGSTMKDQYPTQPLGAPNLRHDPKNVYVPDEAKLDGTTTNAADYPAYGVQPHNGRHFAQKPLTPNTFEAATTNGDMYPVHAIEERNTRHFAQKPMTANKFEGASETKSAFPAHAIEERNTRHFAQKPLTPNKFDSNTTNGDMYQGNWNPDAATRHYVQGDNLKQDGAFDGTTTNKADYPAHAIEERNTRHFAQKPLTPNKFEGTSENTAAYPAPPPPTQINSRHLALPPMLPTLPFDGTTTNASQFKGWQLPPRRPALGVQMVNDKAYILIPANAPLPAMGRQTFTTCADDQANISVLVLEGDFSMASRCSVLGQFDLEGIPPATEGLPRIQITFMISKDGLLTCHAMDLDTKRHEQWLANGKMTVTPSPGNSLAGSKPVSR